MSLLLWESVSSSALLRVSLCGDVVGLFCAESVGWYVGEFMDLSSFSLSVVIRWAVLLSAVLMCSASIAFAALFVISEISPTEFVLSLPEPLTLVSSENLYPSRSG